MIGERLCPLSGDRFKFDPTEVLGRFKEATVGGMSLLAI